MLLTHFPKTATATSHAPITATLSTVTILLVDERFKPFQRTAYDVSVPLNTRQGCQEGQFYISTKELVKVLVGTSAINGQYDHFVEPITYVLQALLNYLPHIPVILTLCKNF